MVAASMVPLGAPAPQPSRRASAGTAVAEGGFEDDEDFEMVSMQVVVACDVQLQL
jgi:hypothetical protein